MADPCGELGETAPGGLGGGAMNLGSALTHASCCVSTPFSANSVSAAEWLALLIALIETRQPLHCVAGERHHEQYEGPRVCRLFRLVRLEKVRQGSLV